MKDKIKNILDITFWKFVLVGIVNTLVGTAVMFAAYNVLHLSYWISSASNYVVGSIVSYFLNKYFTFQNKEKSWKQMVKFALNITAVPTSVFTIPTNTNFQNVISSIFFILSFIIASFSLFIYKIGIALQY